jgi:hypothetical protein
MRALDLMLSCKHEPLGDARHNIACWLEDNIFDLLEQWNFNITSGGEHVTMPTPMGKTFNFFPQRVFTSLDLPFFIPDRQNNQQPFCQLWFWVCICHDKVDYEDDMHHV